jgi:hypothetical protein
LISADTAKYHRVHEETVSRIRVDNSRNQAVRTSSAIALAFLIGHLPASATSAEIALSELEALQVGFDVAEIELSPGHSLLFLREGTTSIHVVDLPTGKEIDSHLANEQFSDMDLAPGGEVLFAADFGGADSFGNPVRTHYVHRFDLVKREWKVLPAPRVAWKVEAVSADSLLLESKLQSAEISLNGFSDTVVELSRVLLNYGGDFEYDVATGLIYHAVFGLSGSQVYVLKAADPQFQVVGYLSDRDHSNNSTCVLSPGGGRLYNGALQLDPRDVRNILHLFPEQVLAASADLAFSETKYYYAPTGAEAGTLGFSSRVYAVTEEGKELLSFQADGRTVHRYRIGPATDHGLLDLSVDGPAGIGPLSSARFTATTLYRDGSAEDVSSRVEWSASEGTIDGRGLLTAPGAPASITVTARFTEGKTIEARASIQCLTGYDQSGVIESDRFRLAVLPDQIEYALASDLLFLRIGSSRIDLLRAATREAIDSHLPNHQFNDMDLTPDGAYLFASESGGVSEPSAPHSVHRFDIKKLQWKVLTAPYGALRIEAASGDRVLLFGADPVNHISINDFADSLTEISRESVPLYGDFKYDSKTGRIYFADLLVSGGSVHAYRLTGDLLEALGQSSLSGDTTVTTCTLSSDATSFYYSRYRLDALRIEIDTIGSLGFPDPILAASKDIAFAERRYYDARTAAPLSGLGFSSTVQVVSETGKHLWAYQQDRHELHHYLLGMTNAGFHRGDSNGDGRVDISDGIDILDFIFLGGSLEGAGGVAMDCLAAADANDDGGLDCTDPIAILGWLFLGTPAPAAPGPPPAPCGPDPNPSELDCVTYPYCD